MFRGTVENKHKISTSCIRLSSLFALMLACALVPSVLLSHAAHSQEADDMMPHAVDTKTYRNLLSMFEPITPQVENQSAETGIESTMYLDVPILEQYPEFPTGCEAVALTELLMFYGFDVHPAEMVDEYLPISEDGEDFVYSFTGDPRSYEGGVIMPPGIVDTANRYFERNSISKHGVDISGESVEELLFRISSGQPVEIWFTLLGDYPGEPSAESEDGRYHVYPMSHAAVLRGYDREAGTVMFSDPIYGELILDLDVFQSSYESVGQLAVVIEDKPVSVDSVSRPLFPNTFAKPAIS